jgi:hypothetical protein
MLNAVKLSVSVIVVPTFAPQMTPSDRLRVSKQADGNDDHREQKDAEPAD